jgi:multiple sugar transport system substrate-binding protein
MEGTMTAAISRRSVILGGVGTLALAIAGCGGGRGGTAQESNPTTLSVVTANNPWATGIKAHLQEFTSRTGITVNVESYGNEQLNDQYKVKLNASASDFDVMVFQPQDVMREFSRNGWITDLTANVTGAPAEWTWNDFSQSARDAVTLDGAVFGVPLMTENHVMYYRRDLLEQRGIAVPATIEELEAAASALHDPSRGFFGLALRGQRVPAVTQFSSFLYSFGGDFQDGGKASIDTPEAMTAYETYGRLLRQYGPPGATNMGWVEASAIFAQGKAAFYLDADSQAYTFLDPTKSAVVDTVAYGSFPAGPAGAKPYSTVPWAAGINAFSARTQAAWDFITWATAPERFATFMVEATLPSPRASTWADATATAKYPKGLVDNAAAIEGRAVGHDRPQLEQVARAREIIGGPLVTAVEGGDVATAAREAQKAFQDLLDADA